MRIAVPELARGEQRARIAQVEADRPVRRVELVVDDTALRAEPQPVRLVEPARIDGEYRVDSELPAQLEIVLAMVRRHVDETRALVGRDEVARKERPRLGEAPAQLPHRVERDGAGKVGAFEAPDLLHRARDARSRQARPLSLSYAR